MDKPSATPQTHRPPRAWFWLILAFLLFAFLMGIRPELPSIWLRAAAAGLAFVLLFLAVHRFRHTKA